MSFSLFPIKNFPNESFANIFSILFIFIAVIELSLLRKTNTRTKNKKDFFIILAGIIFPIILMISLSFTNLGNISTNFSYLGIIFLVGGFILRQVSIKILGKFFVPTIEKQKAQEVIKKGPYKYIRHPSYTGLLLELSGLALSLSNWISLLSVFIIFLPAISYRIKNEEKFLSKNLKGYSEYMKKTKKLVPFVY